MSNPRTVDATATDDHTPETHQRWITVGATRFHYRIAGAATSGCAPLVLVHGLGVSGAYWGRIQPLLARRRPVYAPDLPGFGQTTKPRRLLDTVELAHALGDWLAAMQLLPVYLVGHSMGGQVVAEYCRAFPDTVSRAVLIGATIGTRGARAPRQAFGLLRDSAHERGGLLTLILRDYLRAGPVRVIGTDMRADDDDTIATVAHLRLPLLVVRGGNDTVVPREDATHLLHAASDARYREIPHGPHAVQWTHPHTVAAIIEDFLDARGEIDDHERGARPFGSHASSIGP